MGRPRLAGRGGVPRDRRHHGLLRPHRLAAGQARVVRERDGGDGVPEVGRGAVRRGGRGRRRCALLRRRRPRRRAGAGGAPRGGRRHLPQPAAPRRGGAAPRGAQGDGGLRGQGAARAQGRPRGPLPPRARRDRRRAVVAGRGRHGAPLGPLEAGVGPPGRRRRAVVLGAGRLAAPRRGGVPPGPLPREPRDPRGPAGQAAGRQADRAGPRRRQGGGRRAAEGLPVAGAGAPPRGCRRRRLPGGQLGLGRRRGAVAGHHGVRQPAPLRRADGLGAVRLVARGRLRHGQAHKPPRERPGRAAHDCIR